MKKDRRDGERVGGERRGERMGRAGKKRRKKGIGQRGKTSDPVRDLCLYYPFGSLRE
jgi:hypothetical protein